MTLITDMGACKLVEDTMHVTSFLDLGLVRARIQNGTMSYGELTSGADFKEALHSHFAKPPHPVRESTEDVTGPASRSSISEEDEHVLQSDMETTPEVSSTEELQSDEDSEEHPTLSEVYPEMNFDLTTYLDESSSAVPVPTKDAKHSGKSNGPSPRSPAKLKQIFRKKMTIWILFFALLLVWIELINLFVRLTSEKNEEFSMALLKPWLLPILVFEIALTGSNLCTLAFKMKLLGNRRMESCFDLTMALTTTQYFMLLLLLPCGVYCFLVELLPKEMQKLLGQDSDLENEEQLAWEVTQLERQCCGYENRHDWENRKGGHDDDNDTGSGEGQTVYPASCCKSPLEVQSQCTEASKAYWAEGCHGKECDVIREYASIVLALVLSAAVITIFLRTQIKLLERYLIIFRPMKIFY